MGLIENVLNTRFIDKLRISFFRLTKLKINVKRLSASSSEDLRIVTLLKTFNCDKVLDVGANMGQFSERLIDYGFNGEVVSFEPTKEAYESLLKRAQKYKKWTIAEKCAIGNGDGNIEMNISQDILFNSIKEIKGTYVNYNDNASVVKKEKVNIYRLDSLKGKYWNEKEKLFLKVDTQGFEKEVLEGAEELLKHVKGVKIEIPLQPIYADVEWKLKEFVEYFASKDFECVSLENVAVNNKTGIVLEIDGVFIKKKELNKLEL